MKIEVPWSLSGIYVHKGLCAGCQFTATLVDLVYRNFIHAQIRRKGVRIVGGDHDRVSVRFTLAIRVDAGALVLDKVAGFATAGTVSNAKSPYFADASASTFFSEINNRTS